MRGVIIVQVARRRCGACTEEMTPHPRRKMPLEFHSRVQYRSCVPPPWRIPMPSLSRRAFLSAAAPLPLLGLSHAFAGEQRRPRAVAVYSVFFRRSHAFNILENFLLPYLFNGKRIQSPVDVVSLYADQRRPKDDMTDEVARRFKIPAFKSIRDALTLGGKELAVDAVLSIGEHGDYPTNKFGQVEYPRKRFFDEIFAVMRQAGRYVPVFNDKHLSYR